MQLSQDIAFFPNETLGYFLRSRRTERALPLRSIPPQATDRSDFEIGVLVRPDAWVHSAITEIVRV
jgi:hypothetical protein